MAASIPPAKRSRHTDIRVLYFGIKLFFRLAAMCVAARSRALEVVFGVGSYIDHIINPFLGSTRKRVPRYGPVLICLKLRGSSS